MWQGKNLPFLWAVHSKMGSEMVKLVRPGTFSYLAINQCMCSYTKIIMSYFYPEKEGLRETLQPWGS